jgi:hypothetical protein
MEEFKQDNKKCQRCKVDYSVENFNKKRNGVVLKTCKRCLEKIKESKAKNKCEHNKDKTRCVDCKGGSICEHNQLRTRCKQCGGGEFCEHNARNSRCLICKGAEICEHQRQRAQCKFCNDPIDLTIKVMINCSKQSDKINSRYDPVNFIDYCFVENLIDDSGGKCCYCKTELQYREHNISLATIERIDNSIGHIKGNCKIACLSCNNRRVGSKRN